MFNMFHNTITYSKNDKDELLNEQKKYQKYIQILKQDLSEYKEKVNKCINEIDLFKIELQQLEDSKIKHKNNFPNDKFELGELNIKIGLKTKDIELAEGRKVVNERKVNEGNNTIQELKMLLETISNKLDSGENKLVNLGFVNSLIEGIKIKSSFAMNKANDAVVGLYKTTSFAVENMQPIARYTMNTVVESVYDTSSTILNKLLVYKDKVTNLVVNNNDYNIDVAEKHYAEVNDDIENDKGELLNDQKRYQKYIKILSQELSEYKEKVNKYTNEIDLLKIELQKLEDRKIKHKNNFPNDKIGLGELNIKIHQKVLEIELAEGRKVVNERKVNDRNNTIQELKMLLETISNKLDSGENKLVNLGFVNSLIEGIKIKSSFAMNKANDAVVGLYETTSSVVENMRPIAKDAMNTVVESVYDTSSTILNKLLSYKDKVTNLVVNNNDYNIDVAEKHYAEVNDDIENDKGELLNDQKRYQKYIKILSQELSEYKEKVNKYTNEIDLLKIELQKLEDRKIKHKNNFPNDKIGLGELNVEIGQKVIELELTYGKKVINEKKVNDDNNTMQELKMLLETISNKLDSGENISGMRDPGLKCESVGDGGYHCTKPKEIIGGDYDISANDDGF